ncbi:hypothetical protein ACLBOM_34800 [Escherichia coli]
MSTSDDIHNTTTTGKCPFHQGGHDQSAGGGHNHSRLVAKSTPC